MTITIDENIRLELTADKHAEPLFAAIDNNREHLSRFLPWVGDMQTVDDVRDYIRNCESLYANEQEVSFVIQSGDIVVGRIGLHHRNLQNKSAAIGYWLRKDVEGNGIISKCCKALIDYGFQELGMHRIEIKAAVGNKRSQAIPIRLNFKREGVLREAEFVNNEFLDLVLFSILRNEWVEK